jgi:hypothetical protein
MIKFARTVCKFCRSHAVACIHAYAVRVQSLAHRHRATEGLVCDIKLRTRGGGRSTSTVHKSS